MIIYFRSLDQRINEFLRLTEMHKRDLSGEISHYIRNPENHEVSIVTLFSNVCDLALGPE